MLIMRIAVVIPPELVGNWIDRPAQPLQEVQVDVNKQPQEPSVKRGRKQCQTAYIPGADFDLIQNTQTLSDNDIL